MNEKKLKKRIKELEATIEERNHRIEFIRENLNFQLKREKEARLMWHGRYFDLLEENSKGEVIHE